MECGMRWMDGIGWDDGGKGPIGTREFKGPRRPTDRTTAVPKPDSIHSRDKWAG